VLEVATICTWWKNAAVIRFIHTGCVALHCSAAPLGAVRCPVRRRNGSQRTVSGVKEPGSIGYCWDSDTNNVTPLDIRVDYTVHTSTLLVFTGRVYRHEQEQRVERPL